MHHWKFGKCNYCQQPEGKLVNGLGATTNPGSDRECEEGGKCVFKFAKCCKCGAQEYTSGTQRRLSRNSLKLRNAVQLDQSITALFGQFDANGDGTISREEFKEIVLAANNITFDEDDIERFLQDADEDGDGVIDMLEFSRWVKASSDANDVIESVKASRGELVKSKLRGPERFYYDEATYTGIHSKGGA